MRHGALFVLGLAFFPLLACEASKPQKPPGADESALTGSADHAPSQAPTPEPARARPDLRTPEPAPSPSGDVEGIRLVTGEALVAELGRSGRKGTVVNAWASWCGPCRREFPMLAGLRAQLRSKGIDVVFVSVDEPEGYRAALDFAAENGVAPPLAVAARPLGAFKQALSPRWQGMLPATFFFDGGGKLRYFWGGPVYENELLPVVDGFLRGEKIDGEAIYGLTPGRDLRGSAD